MSWTQTFVICGLALGAMILMAGFLGEAHAPQRKACIEAGYEWSATKYVCVVKPPIKK